MKRRYPIRLGGVDRQKLATEAGLQAEADRLLPEFLRQYSEAVAETLHDALKDTFRGGKGLKLTVPSRGSFIRDQSREYVKKLKPADRNVHRQWVVDQLRTLAAEGGDEVSGEAEET